MNEEMITLAIHSLAKAEILKSILEQRGVMAMLEPVVSAEVASIKALESYSVRIKQSDLTKALTIIEENKLFSYKDDSTYQVDDGRKRVLVPVDFSDYSLKACQVAFHIAHEMNAKVKILHVYHNIYFPSHIPFAESLKETPDEGLMSKARKQMLQLCCEIDNKITDGEWDSVNYSYSLREGQVSEEIENFVVEYKPFLVVLGTKGKDRTQSFILGNVTSDVIEAIDVPVLAIPEDIDDVSKKSVTHIAFLTNLQSNSISSFNSFVDIMKPYEDVKITLLHINRLNRKGDKWQEPELISIRDNFLKTYPQLNICYKLIDSPNIPEAVSDFVDKEGVSMICITTKKRNLFGKMFMPSLSRKVLDKAEKMLLVLRR